MKLKPLIRIDPFFNEIPWEIIYDEKGRVLGEVYIIPIAKRPEYLKRGNTKGVTCMKRKTKEQAERECKQLETVQRQEAQELEKARKLAKQKEEAKRREWLREQRSRPRMEVPSEYCGESIYVHKKIYDGFMKKRNITITRCYPKGGSGGSLIMEYRTSTGGIGTVELLDLGPMSMLV